jgi:hypothetical protein
MNSKNYQALANQYYRLTEETYRKLDSGGTDFMNLGLWPASTISKAQSNIYSTLAHFVTDVLKKENTSQLDLLVELGCGWGGGVPILIDTIKPSKFIGVNSSETQIKHCKSKYDSEAVQFHHGFYESLQIQKSNTLSLALGVESLLHCGNRSAVFEMIERNNFDYIALAEILLRDKEDRGHKLFNPALSYVADFTEYSKLFNLFGYELVLEKDISENVLKPWVTALKELTPELRGIHKKIKNQFIEAYTILSDLSDQKRAKYVLLVAKKSETE